MHDAPGEAIQFSEDAKLKIISLVADEGAFSTTFCPPSNSGES